MMEKERVHSDSAANKLLAMITGMESEDDRGDRKKGPRKFTHLCVFPDPLFQKPVFFGHYQIVIYELW